MAEKRMFTQKIIDSDAFLDMPLSTQALYFHLNMRADDDGFVNSPKRIQRAIGASDDDLKLLFAKRFVIGFESGVIVIKHWKMHNTLRKDRYNPTQYQEELALLEVKDNNAYTERLALPETGLLHDGNQMATTWQPNDNQSGNHLATQYSLVENSLVENRGEKKRVIPSVADSDESEQPRTNKKPTKHKYGEFKNVLLTDSEYDNLIADHGLTLTKKAISFLDEYIEEKGYKSKSHNLAIRRWVIDAVRERDKGNKTQIQKAHQPSGNPFLDLLKGEN